MVGPIFVRILVFLTFVIGCILKFLPPYLPVMNLIEESFSSGEQAVPWYLLNNY